MKAWSSSTADTWETGVIAGTGVIGAVVYGAPDEHIAVLAHERFFVPANSRTPAPDLAPSLGEVRAALAEGDSTGAADVVQKRLIELGRDPQELIWTDPLAPLAEIAWSPRLTDAAAYRRALDTAQLGADLSWSSGGGRMGLRLSAIHGEEAMIFELWSEVAVEGSLILRPVGERRSGASTVETVDYSLSTRSDISASPRRLRAEVSASGLEPGTGVVAVISVQSDVNESVSGGGWDIALPPRTSRFFRVTITTDAPGPTIDVRGEQQPSLSSELQLIGADASDHVEEIWQAARDGADAPVRRTIELAYAAGLRNIVASTGALPPTLQGVWQGTWSPAWSADYTLNGNVQLGTLASVLWTGNPALMRSLFRLIRQFPEHYRNNARAVFGVTGMLLPARMTTHGHANHFLRDYPHQFWTGHGSWLLRMAADYIQVTGDRSILDEWLWQYTEEILAFGLDLVAESGGHLNPSYSPENTPAGSDNPLVVDATADVAALRDGLKVGAWLATLHGDADQAAAWREARTALPPFAIAADGTLAEWAADWRQQIAHRHASHLHGLWYEPDEAFDRADLNAAALETVRRKIAWRAEAPYGPPGNMEMAFGLSSIGLAAANLGDGDAALQCALWLARDHFTPALVSTHDAGAIFNLDASGALPAVVAAMLVGSSVGELRLLPALPSTWSGGGVTNLAARGGVVVDSLAWDPWQIACALHFREEAAWLRSETRVRLPRTGTLVESSGASQIGPDELSIPSDARDIRFSFRFTTPLEDHVDHHRD